MTHTTDIAVERATRDDLDAILEIEHRCFPSDSFSRGQFLYLITKAKGDFYVIKERDTVVAYLNLLFNIQAKMVRIYSIAVHPDARGKKYGDLLMQKTIDTAVEKQMKTISLEVHPANTVAINLYRKYGFTMFGVRPNYYADGSNAHVMRVKV